MVTLKPLTENDLPFLLEVRNDESTRQFLEHDSKFTLKEALKWFRGGQPEWFIIEINRTPIGYIRTNGDEVGCDIHPNFRRRGYAKMAYELYLQDKDYASLWVFEDNFAIKLYKKLGFTPTGNSRIVRDRNYIKMEYNGK
jgi:RimJ/RimL family protein N-acetyltransferase